MDETDSQNLDRLIARRRAGTIDREAFVRRVLAIIGAYDVLSRSLFYASVEDRVGETFAEFWGPSHSMTTRRERS